MSVSACPDASQVTKEPRPEFSRTSLFFLGNDKTSSPQQAERIEALFRRTSPILGSGAKCSSFGVVVDVTSVSQAMGEREALRAPILARSTSLRREAAPLGTPHGTRARCSCLAAAPSACLA